MGVLLLTIGVGGVAVATVSLLLALRWHGIQLPPAARWPLVVQACAQMLAAIVFALVLGRMQHLEQGGDGAFIFGFLYIAGANAALALALLPWRISQLAQCGLKRAANAAIAYALLVLPGLIAVVILYALLIGPYWWAKYFTAPW